MKKISLSELNLGLNWAAEQAWISEKGNPIVLVEISGKSERIRARLDLGKRVFIDPVPFSSSGELVNRLVGSISTRSTGPRDTAFLAV